MILVPRWDEGDDDAVLEALVDTLLTHMGSLGPTDDVRRHTKSVQAALAAAVHAPVGAAANPEEIDLDEDSEMQMEMTMAGVRLRCREGKRCHGIKETGCPLGCMNQKTA